LHGSLPAVRPGASIVLSAPGFDLMGNGLRNLWDPRLARQR